MQDANEGLRSWREILGAQIREARQKAGLTQEALGKAIGKSRNIIIRYESGSDAPSVDVLGTIALNLAMSEVNINGYRFAVSPRLEGMDARSEQLELEFYKEHVYHGATIRITPTKTTISITATAPLKVANG